MKLKRLLPMDVHYRIKHLREFLHQTTPQTAPDALQSDRRVFFLDTPSYGNLGDQAIAFAMRKFVGDVLPQFGQVEIAEDSLPQSIRWVEQNIRPCDIICLTGGGNMGTMYRHYECVRRYVIRRFRSNPIVVFPQTIDYGTDFVSRRELHRASRIYGAHPHLVLCARDERSYQVMKENFPTNKVLFCPDIVLSLDYPHIADERGDSVGICLRSDRECAISADFRPYLHAKYPDGTALSTMRPVEGGIGSDNRQQVVEQVLRDFASSHLVVTDRLHGVIFSYITHTPCIALPNSNGKVEQVCRYLSPSGRVVFCRTKEEVESAAFSSPHSSDTLKDRFSELPEVLKSL